MSAIAHAAADLLTATAIAWEGRRGGPLTRAAELFDRAAHETSRPVPAGPGSRGYELRAAARLVAVMGELSGGQATAEALKLVRSLARLADAIAELRTARQRLHQADAALAAAHLRSYAPQGSRTDEAAFREQARLSSPEARSQGRGR